jgi:glycine/D-amino acid oxidase-like deaminating enzyme
MQTNKRSVADVAVVGGGLVGSAIAYGLAGQNLSVVLIDGGDRDFRASGANGGLVWVQGKGLGMPAYQQITRSSGDLWPSFCEELTDGAPTDIHYIRNGGVNLCLGETEFQERRAKMTRLQEQLGGAEPDWEMLDRTELQKLLPKVRLGSEVSGGSLGRTDGHVNPLLLLAALHAGFLRRGGKIRAGYSVRSVQRDGNGFDLDLGSENVPAGRIVIAAGLGTKALAAQVGLDLPIRPQRGQMLVTERLAPSLPLPLDRVRQTFDGTIMIGTTNEEVSFDNATTAQAAIAMSVKAMRCLPGLRDVKLVRQWAGLRIMTPDGYPIYAQSERCPGAFVATCHSGVTLAGLHAGPVAAAIAAGELPPSLQIFNERRFDVPKAA